jgi:hypothetical protein
LNEMIGNKVVVEQEDGGERRKSETCKDGQVTSKISRIAKLAWAMTRFNCSSYLMHVYTDDPPSIHTFCPVMLRLSASVRT